MATLTGTKPKDTYKDLLQVSNSNSGVDATLRNVSDGEATSSALQVSTTGVKSTGTLAVTGNTTLSGTLAVTGAITSSSTVTHNGAVTHSSTTVIQDGTAATHPMAIQQLQDGKPYYYAGSGTNAITATPSPALSAYAAGQRVSIKIANTNTASCTLNLNALGAKTIKMLNGDNPLGGELLAGGIYDFQYDGTNFILLNPSPVAIGFHAYASGADTLTDGVWKKISVNTELWDAQGWYDAATNYRLTPLLAGKYLVGGSVSFAAGGSGERKFTAVYKNGTIHSKFGGTHSSTAAQLGATGSCIVSMNGSTDYVELYANTVGAGDDTVAGQETVYFFAEYLGA